MAFFGAIDVTLLGVLEPGWHESDDDGFCLRPTPTLVVKSRLTSLGTRVDRIVDWEVGHVTGLGCLSRYLQRSRTMKLLSDLL